MTSSVASQMVVRFDTKLAKAVSSRDSTAITVATDNAEAAREALAALERDADTIEWVNALGQIVP